ncbi:hypothetical protein UAJ10_27075 [Nitrospirillum sp. BR 11164]|uniref:hypothetical protein n=1 Tax=Nitrospirillum sp. BR 11164 TaxID=3104324 RepID=UPI002AFFCEE5|nr:hypothetical protein [Nitrospirillum sp. BR 11164]MEA1652662.1 hypothetical protein [Nitrospirillum sp. BR 11164]
MESTVIFGSLSGIMSAYNLAQGQLGWSMLLALKQTLDRHLAQDEAEDGTPADGEPPATPS